MTTLINLTPHPVTIGELTIPPAAKERDGWDEHGHAIPTGIHDIDKWLGNGELQDAENCGYLPDLDSLGVDEQFGPAADQYRAGRIYLTGSVVLSRGGTLNCVWAVTAMPAPARCVERAVDVEPITVAGHTIPVQRITYGEVTGLPFPIDGIAYIVSLPVAQRVPSRRDVYTPGRVIRDAQGRPAGAVGLAQVAL